MKRVLRTSQTQLGPPGVEQHPLCEELSSEINNLNKEIDRLGYEIQSISLNIARINMEIKRERGRIMNNETLNHAERVGKWLALRTNLLEKRRKAVDALKKRVNEIREMRERRRELWQKMQLLKNVSRNEFWRRRENDSRNLDSKNHLA